MSTVPAFTPIDHIADARKHRKTRQAFYTPIPLVGRMVEEAGVYPGAIVLEPSGGDGRIVHALVVTGATVEACEIDAAMNARCASLGAAMVGTDFLKYAPGRRYDAIVMNPPFTRKQDAKHIQHAYTMLKPYGRLVAVASSGLADTIAGMGLDLPGCQHATYEDLPPETFSESGANVKTILVTIDGAHPPREVEGFKNWATYGAAITVASDGEAYRDRRSLTTPGAFQMRFQREIARHGASVYGIDWQEVAEYVRMSWGMDSPSPASPAPAETQDTPKEERP